MFVLTKLAKWDVFSTDVLGEKLSEKESNEINTMHRKLRQMYRADHCYHVSTEPFTCYLHGKQTITILIMLTIPIWRRTYSIRNAYLPLIPAHTQQDTYAHLINFQLCCWPSLWTTPRKICAFKWFRTKPREVLIHGRATSKTNQME